MGDISGFGAVVTLTASVTFPNGITLTEFADDTDPFDPQVTTLGAVTMGVNGDLSDWSVASPINLNLALMPRGEDDTNLQILAEVNRVGYGKTSARDTIDLTVVYADGKGVIYSTGKLLTAIIGNAISSGGRLKSKPYGFAFQNRADF